MAAVVNSIDKILRAAPTRTTNLASARILLTPTTNAFHVNAAGANDPASITLTAALIDLEGTITFSAVGGTLTDVTATTAALTYANMPGATATVTASVISNGQTYSAPCFITKVLDGAKGDQGPTGTKSTIVYAYQRAASPPAGLPGAADYDFTSNTITTATLANGWLKTIPAANGNPLYVTAATASAAGTTATIAAGQWSAAVVLAQDGQGGAAGLNSATVRIYQRTASATAPALPSVAATYTFANGGISGLNNGWLAAVPTTGGGFLHTSAATAAATTPTDSIASTEWAGVSLMAQDGQTGASGTQVATARMYQWATTAPAKPTGTTTWTWATAANAAYSASDGWAVDIPANPGTPLAKLYTADMPITAAAGVVSSTVSYASSTVSAVSQNGSNGSNGSNGTSGLQSFAPTVYQWAATIPAGPAGAATLTWPTGFGAAPTNWSLTPGTAPSPGFTLWAAPVQVSDSAANPTTAFNWSSAAVIAIGYAGGNGQPGAEGASYVTAYCASATGATTTAPAATTGKTSLPAANSGGLAGTYSATVPALAAGQYLYQTDGIYNPATNQVIWSIPYWSSLKVATLSAITANLGAINAGSIDLGAGATSWHVDPAGNQWSGAATFAAAPYRVGNNGAAVATALTIQTPDGTVLLSSSGLTAAGAAPGTLNSAVTLSPTGALLNAGGGQITSIATIDGGTGTTVFGQRQRNDAPSEYPVGTSKQFKDASSLLLPGAAASAWCTLETVKQYVDGSGGGVYQYLYRDASTYRRYAPSAVGAVGTWGAWVLDLDRNSYTGDLNATVGADANNLQVGIGSRNLLTSNALPSNTDGYAMASYNMGTSTANGPTYGAPSTDAGLFSPLGMGNVYAYVAGVPPVDAFLDIFRTATRVRVLAGARYEFSVALSTYHCQSHVRVAWYNAAGANISQDGGAYVNRLTAKYPGTAIFPRSLLLVTAPATAVEAMIFVRQYHDGAEGECYTYTSQWYVGEALPAQTAGSPWTDSPTSLAANAAAGKGASDALPGINSAIAARLNKNAADTLAGRVGLQANGAIVAGDLAFDASGNRTSGTGSAMNQKGFVHYGPDGTAAVVINAAGVAVKGDISGSTGTFGAVVIGSTMTIAAGGLFSIGKTAYGAGGGNGLWFGFHAGVPKFRVGDDNQYIDWDGTKLTQKLDTFTVSLSGTLATTVANGKQTYGTLTATVVGGTGTVELFWEITNLVSDDLAKTVSAGMDLTANALARGVYGSTTNNSFSFRVKVTARDSTSRQAFTNYDVSVIHGTVA